MAEDEALESSAESLWATYAGRHSGRDGRLAVIQLPNLSAAMCSPCPWPDPACSAPCTKNSKSLELKTLSLLFLCTSECPLMIQHDAKKCSTCFLSSKVDGGADSSPEGDAFRMKSDRSKERRAEADCSLQHLATPWTKSCHRRSPSFLKTELIIRLARD